MEHASFSQETLPCLGSDRVPILLSANAISSGLRPFKFELMWVEVSGFKDKIKKNGGRSLRWRARLVLGSGKN